MIDAVSGYKPIDGSAEAGAASKIGPGGIRKMHSMGEAEEQLQKVPSLGLPPTSKSATSGGKAGADAKAEAASAEDNNKDGKDGHHKKEKKRLSMISSSGREELNQLKQVNRGRGGR